MHAMLETLHPCLDMVAPGPRKSVSMDSRQVNPDPVRRPQRPNLLICKIKITGPLQAKPQKTPTISLDLQLGVCIASLSQTVISPKA